MLNDRLVFDAMVINRISFSLYNPFASTDAKAGFFTEESSGCHIMRIIETKEETGKLVLMRRNMKVVFILLKKIGPCAKHFGFRVSRKTQN